MTTIDLRPKKDHPIAGISARVTPIAVLALLAIGFAISIGTFVALGTHAHPAKDDYLSAVMFRDLGIPASLKLQYSMHNGRLFSALIMRFSPLQYHSLEGYKLVCIGFVLLFAGTLFLFTDSVLKHRLHRADRIAVFFALYLSFHGAFGNLAEFYFWLPAISCYGSASLLFLALLRLMPAAITKGLNTAWAYVLVSALAGIAISFCSEPGAVMSLGALFIFGVQAYRQRSLSVSAFLILVLAILAGFVVAACSPGNALRIATSPHERSVLQTLAGAAYSMTGNLLRMAYFLIPALIFCAAIFRKAWPQLILSGYLLTRLVLIIGAFWAATELIAFYGIGGMAALRVRNCIVFLGAVLLLVSLDLSISSNSSKASPGKRYGHALIPLSALWITLGIFMSGHPVCGGIQDLVSGSASRYDSDMRALYQEASRRSAGDAFLNVRPVREIPASLYVAQPLILKEEIHGWPWLNIKMSAYFGHERLYADSLAKTPSSEEAFQNWIRSRRASVFK